ncbi:hypothetical protein VHEMI05748 [[Torrubiella] hemipterigena]|uniref:Uncharacterized protein n=1 Tax=[Torrubiella] hemipterigena TaxID=1531966 RepID=A0A0A1T529_9HYPO|nr:hypothetical protein VHEMI05748 [[Torrubiella] hemipterigena]
MIPTSARASPHARLLVTKRVAAASSNYAFRYTESIQRQISCETGSQRAATNPLRQAESLAENLSSNQPPPIDSLYTSRSPPPYGASKTTNAKYLFKKWQSPAHFVKDIDANKSFNGKTELNASAWKKSKASRGGSPKQKLSKYDVSQIKVGELSQYASANFDDPVISQQIAVGQSSNTHNDLAKYRPLEWSESFDAQALTSEKRPEQYDDLAMYKSSEFADTKVSPSDAMVGSYDSSTNAVDEPSKEVTENYTSVTWNEPNGLQQITAEEQSKDYDDLKDYQVGFTAKDSVLKAHEEAQLDTTVKGKPLSAKVEVVAEDNSKDYKDLGSYGPVKWNEPDGLPTQTAEELSKDYNDLKQYQGYDNSDPTVERVHPEEVVKQYKDLAQYRAQVFEEPTMPAQVQSDEGSQSYNDLHKYRSSEIDSVLEQDTRSENATKVSEELGRYTPEMMNEATVTEVAAADAVADAVAAGLKEFDMISRSKGDVSRLPVVSRPSLALEFHSIAAAEKPGEPDASSMDESFPPESGRLREVINRLSGNTPMTPAQKMAVENDPYSKSPQGLETSYEQERGDKAAWPLTARHHQGRLAAEEAGFALFKMMAYDSSTRSVSIAEVSSSAQDNTRASNPAEAILQLAHPSKFFPHFALLQQQGYEIVSGGPDVLVFKKVREASEYLKPQKKRPSRGKRILLGTAGLAGGAYVLSVFSEYFSTGTF